MSRYPNQPTGRVQTTPAGRQLVIERGVEAPIVAGRLHHLYVGRSARRHRRDRVLLGHSWA